MLRPGDIVTFHCKIRCSSILLWTSDLIARGGDRIEVLCDDSSKNWITRGFGTARLLNCINDTGCLMLESQVNITTPDYSAASPLVCHTSSGFNDSVDIHVCRKFSMHGMALHVA